MNRRITAVDQFTRKGVDYDITFFENGMQERGSDGSFSEWNLEHYFRVKSARQAAPQSARPVEHELRGKALLEISTGKTYVVEKVFEQWWQGRSLMAILQHNGSHRQCMIENISCVNPSILRQIDEFKATFKVQTQ